MSTQSNNKTIAKNTLLLYFRMMLTMIITLYTSRVVLKVLGIEDFGIYQTVGGVVGMLSFLNGALAVGTSRFLTFELGTGNFVKLKKTFSTVLSAHFILSFVICLLAETIGLWFVYNKLVIPPGRMGAAIFIYHISILTAMIQLTQVPYNASIISHERMEIYAYSSIVEVSLKLLIVYILTVGGYDKLMLYSILLAIITIGMALYYRFYCIKHFEETHYHFIFDMPILRNVLGYSGWNLLANTSIALNNHGGVLLLNMFFSPSVVTARAIANQVNMAAYHFITNFRTASNPQIVKRYAAKDYEGSKRLLLSTTTYSFFLMLLLALPIILVAEPLLQLWLGQVPPYSVIFLKLTIICSLFQVFDTSFYIALYAKGQIRENALISPSLGFLCFPLVYVLFKMGCSPEIIAWIALLRYAILGLVVKPILIIKIVDYTWNDIIHVFIPCIRVTAVSCILPLFFYLSEDLLPDNIYMRFGVLVFLSAACVLIAIWLVGINSTEKKKVIEFVKSKI